MTDPIVVDDALLALLKATGESARLAKKLPLVSSDELLALITRIEELEGQIEPTHPRYGGARP